MTFLLNPYRYAAAAYDADAEAYFAAMSVQPDDTRKGLIDALIVGLKADGLWTKIDLGYLVAAHDAQAARLNIKAPAGTSMAAFNSPTFTTDRGYKGDGLSSYLGMGFNHNALTLAQQNSTFFSLGLNIADPGRFMLGTVAAGTTIALQPSSPTAWRCNNASNVTVVTSSSSGRFTASRTGSTGFEPYFNGSALGTLTATSAARSASEISLMRTGSNFGAARVSYFFIGSGLTAPEQTAFDARILTYLTALGAT